MLVWRSVCTEASNKNCWRFGGVVLRPFDFEEPEERFTTASRGLDRFSRARSRLEGHFPQWNFVVVGTSLCRGGISESSPQEPIKGHGEIAINHGIDKTFVTV